MERSDARYQKHYHKSVIENLTFIEKHSLAAFIERENAKWRCVLVEQSCAAIMESVIIAALIAYKGERSCTGGMMNNEIDSTLTGEARELLQLLKTGAVETHKQLEI